MVLTSSTLGTVPLVPSVLLFGVALGCSAVLDSIEFEPCGPYLGAYLISEVLIGYGLVIGYGIVLTEPMGSLPAFSVHLVSIVYIIIFLAVQGLGVYVFFFRIASAPTHRCRGTIEYKMGLISFITSLAIIGYALLGWIFLWWKERDLVLAGQPKRDMRDMRDGAPDKLSSGEAGDEQETAALDDGDSAEKDPPCRRVLLEMGDWQDTGRASEALAKSLEREPLPFAEQCLAAPQHAHLPAP